MPCNTSRTISWPSTCLKLIEIAINPNASQIMAIAFEPRKSVEVICRCVASRQASVLHVAMSKQSIMDDLLALHWQAAGWHQSCITGVAFALYNGSCQSLELFRNAYDCCPKDRRPTWDWQKKCCSDLPQLRVSGWCSKVTASTFAQRVWQTTKVAAV